MRRSRQIDAERNVHGEQKHCVIFFRYHRKKGNASCFDKGIAATRICV